MTWKQSEPQTPNGKLLHQWITDAVVTTRREERQRQLIDAEREAAAMGQHTNCINEWAWRAKMSPGVQMTMHDWDAHLGKGFDHE